MISMRIEEERWAAVPESMLEVSDQGHVRSLSLAGAEPYLLKAYPNTCGYPSVGWTWRGKRRSALVHRLVLQAFVGPCPEGMEARHLNGNRTDPRLANLAWGTKRENEDDKIQHGTSARKLCRVQVVEIKNRLLRQETVRSIARRFGISSVTVVLINRGRAWAHVPNPEVKSEGGAWHRSPFPISTATRWRRRPPAQG